MEKCAVCGFGENSTWGAGYEVLLELVENQGRGVGPVEPGARIHVHPICLKRDAATFGYRVAVALGVREEEV